MSRPSDGSSSTLLAPAENNTYKWGVVGLAVVMIESAVRRRSGAVTSSAQSSVECQPQSSRLAVATRWGVSLIGSFAMPE